MSKDISPSSELHTPEALLPVVYDDLRRLAKARLAKESNPATLQPTALVHEAYLRMSEGSEPTQWDGPAHFFAALAEIMRRILVENARRKSRLKRGGGMRRSDIDPSSLPAPDSAHEMLALDEALQKLSVHEPRWAELVKLRYFVGMTIPEAAGVLRIAPRTADSWWASAKDWLQRELDDRKD